MQEIIRVVPGHVASERKALSELGAIVPPASLTHDWQRILGYRRMLASELAKLVAAAKRVDESAVTALSESKKHVRGLLRAAAVRSGFKTCSTLG